MLQRLSSALHRSAWHNQPCSPAPTTTNQKGFQPTCDMPMAALPERPLASTVAPDRRCRHCRAATVRRASSMPRPCCPAVNGRRQDSGSGRCWCSARGKPGQRQWQVNGAVHRPGHAAEVRQRLAQPLNAQASASGCCTIQLFCWLECNQTCQRNQTCQQTQGTRRPAACWRGRCASSAMITRSSTLEPANKNCQWVQNQFDRSSAMIRASSTLEPAKMKHSITLKQPSSTCEWLQDQLKRSSALITTASTLEPALRASRGMDSKWTQWTATGPNCGSAMITTSSTLEPAWERLEWQSRLRGSIK